jgi:acetyltransferase
VVLKGLAPGMAHKTEHGLVKLGISSRAMLENAFSELEQGLNKTGRILIQQQAAADYELIAGFLRDPQFGPCVMFGLGGLLAELEPDVSFALAPLSVEAPLTLIRSLRNYRLLKGLRGMKALDELAAAQVLIQLGNLGTAHPDVDQIDINPLVVCGGKVTAVDATIVIKP